ncbi:MAG: LysR substrate-binding domain-containing protein, partial [Solirubrobacteraceae bacterium]
MELRQLRYFVAVAEELHFRRAAARLHMSQPPLSQQIAALESELGCRLLARTRRQVELTPAGAAFLRDTRALLADLEGAVGRARALGEGLSGVLRVSFVGSALFSVVPTLVQRFRQVRPGVSLELRESSTVDQLRALESGVIDAGLVRPPLDPSPGIRLEPIASEPTIAAVPADHPLARLRRIPLARLAAEPIVLFSREQAPGFHDLIVNRLAATGGASNIVQRAPETLTIIGLVAAGVGVSPVPASVASLALQGVAYRPLTHAPAAELALVTRADDGSSLIPAFAECARRAHADSA